MFLNARRRTQSPIWPKRRPLPPQRPTGPSEDEAAGPAAAAAAPRGEGGAWWEGGGATAPRRERRSIRRPAAEDAAGAAAAGAAGRPRAEAAEAEAAEAEARDPPSPSPSRADLSFARPKSAVRTTVARSVGCRRSSSLVCTMRLRPPFAQHYPHRHTVSSRTAFSACSFCFFFLPFSSHFFHPCFLPHPFFTAHARSRPFSFPPCLHCVWVVEALLRSRRRRCDAFLSLSCRKHLDAFPSVFPPHR